MQVTRACPVCGANDSEPYLEKGSLYLHHCRACSMVYANPSPPEMASGQYYDQTAPDYYLSPAKLVSDYSPVRFDRELRLFRKHCRDGAVLDVGCSTGGFLFQLNSRYAGDYEILGTDVSGKPLDYAESRGVPVVRGKFLEEDFKGRLFDAVTFWAVLEHLAEPKAFLAKARTVVKPNGLCFVLVPNFKSFAARLLGSRYRYIYPQHLNYFTRTTLRRIVAEHFSVVELRSTHLNPIVIWQDFRRSGLEVTNEERGRLLERTTAWKQSGRMAPFKLPYRMAERVLASLGLADNLVVVLRKA